MDTKSETEGSAVEIIAPPIRALRLSALWTALAWLIVVGVVFGRSLNAQFVDWDDNRHLLANPHVNPPSWEGLAQLWLAGYDQLYAPLSYTLFAAETWLGLHCSSQAWPAPVVFHAVSLLLHAGCTMLVYSLLRQLSVGTWPAACGTFLFAVHPLQVESVAWISEQRGLLSALGALAALNIYVRGAHRLEPRWMTNVTVAILTGLAVLAKPTAVVTPLLAVLMDRALIGRGWDAILRTTALMWPVVVFAAVGAKLLQGDTQLDFVPPLWARPLLAADALAFYLGKLVAPVGLAIDYGRSPARMMTSGYVYVAWLIPALVAAALVLVVRRRQALVGALWLVIALLPVLGFVPFVFQETSTVADRYMYLPLVGVALGLAGCLADPPAQLLRWGCSMLMMLLASLSARQVAVWNSSETLFEQALEVNPTSYATYNIVAGLLQQAGQLAAAEDRYRLALQIQPRYLWAHNGLGTLLADSGRLTAAMDEFRAALAIDSQYAEARVNLANALRQTGDRPAALVEYRAALADDPRLATAHANYGQALLEGGDVRGGVEELLVAVRLQPRLAVAHFMLGQARLHQGRFDDARLDFRRALELRPTMVEARVNLGALLLQRQEFDAAEAEFDQVLKEFPANIDALVNKGLTRLGRGDRPGAARYLRQALALCPIGSPRAAAVRRELQQTEAGL